MNTPHTVEITASGYNQFSQSITVDSTKNLDMFLTSSGPGILLHSTMDSLNEIQNPTISTGLMNPPSSALFTSGTGTIDPVQTIYGGGVQLHGQGTNREEIYYEASNFDFTDLAGDGGRIDFKMKFNVDPHSLPNTFIIKTDNIIPGASVSRWFVFEMIGSSSYPWVVFYSDDDPDFWSPQGQPTFQVYTGANWPVWQNVGAGEWHNYTIMWRNNGDDNSELHLFIDGTNAGCTTCSDYGGWMPPLNSFSRLEFGPLINGESADIELDELWSFSRWDHNAGPGTYDESITVPEGITLITPADNELLFTVNPSFDFIATSNIDPASCGGTPTNNWVSLYKETFDGIKTYNHNEQFGTNNWLTAEIRNNGQLIADGSGVVTGTTPNFPDSVMVRTTNSLPDEYLMRIKIGNINADWQSYDNTDYSDPNFKYNCINPLTSECRHPENGVYWLTPTDIPCDMPGGCNEDWWHQHRKAVIDSDDHLNSLVNPGGCDQTHTINSGCEEIEKPLYMVYMQPGAFDSSGNLIDASQLLASWNGSQNWWYTGAWNWEAAIRPYNPSTFYYAEIEKNNGQLIFRLYDSNNNLLEETTPVSLDNIHNMGAAKSPFEYMYFGEPHINSYEGSFQVDEVELLVKEGSQCQCSVMVDGNTVASSVALSGQRQSLTSVNQLTSGSHNWNVECYNGQLTSQTRTFSIDPSAVPVCNSGDTQGSCTQLIDGVSCTGTQTCVSNSWQCIIPPGGCAQNGVGGVWDFQNGLVQNYDGERDSVIKGSAKDTVFSDCAVDDCMLRADSINPTFGAEKHLFYFDISSIPQGSQVSKATVKLTEYNSGSLAGGEITLYKLNEAWDPNTVTWNSFSVPGGNFDPQGITTTIANEGSVTVDITPWVKEWYSGNNYGFLVEQTGTPASTHLTYDTYPSVTDRPYLQVLMAQDVNTFDLDSDSVVDFDDLVVLVTNYYGFSQGSANYNQAFDYNSDAKINILDLIIHIKNWD